MCVKHSIFKTPFGWCALVKSDKGIMRILLPEPHRYVLYDRITGSYPASVLSNECFMEEIEQIQKYFSGQNPVFTFKLDLRHATRFQTRVWEATSEIPYSEVRTYSWIADRIGNSRAVRAVGNALARNPVPVIIPCHRVVRKDGALGGFSAASGTDFKQMLLMLEKGRGSI